MIPGNPWKTVYYETKYGYDGDDVVDAQAVDAVAVEEGQQPRSYSGFIDLLVGIIIDISAASVTFSLEVCAIAFRFVARGFEYLYDKCYHSAVTKYTIGVLFWILWKCFWFTEHVLLYTSVFVSELLAGVSWMLCGLFALDCQVGKAAHQRTRRLCHLIRWACRRPCGSNDGGTFPPQGTHEMKQEQAMPSATAIPEGSAQNNNIQTATVVAIHDDVESNK